MNEELINKFCNYILSRGLSAKRIRKYRGTLNTLSRLLKKDFKKCKKEDLINLFADIQSDKIKWDKNGTKIPYAENTKKDFRVIIKIFWKWLKKTDEYPDEVKWIRSSTPSRLLKKIKTKDVLTEEEVYKMIDVAQHTRDKGIISLLYESGSRIGEIIDLKISDIVFDDKGYSFVSCLGKTGETYKRVVNFKAVELLKNWINEHPLRDNGNSPLWITLVRSHTGIKRMDYSGFNKMLKEVGQIANIEKKVNPHAFRHARITNLRVVRKVSDAVIETLVGWKQGSNMFDTYSHTKSEDVDKALAENYGLKEEQKKNQMIEKFDVLLAKDSSFRKKIAKLLQERNVKV